MKHLCLCASMALVVTAFLALPLEAQKGKGGGKNGGGQNGGGKNAAKNAGKSKPQQSESKRLPTGPRAPARQFDHPKSGNSLPQEVRDKLPPGLRDKPENHPGLANHLRKMGTLKDYPAVDPIPPEVRSQLPPGLRDRTYDHPGVANHLRKLGWTIDEDGALVPPPLNPPPVTQPPLTQPPLTQPPVTQLPLTQLPLTQPTQPSVTQGVTPSPSFGPFGGFFRRR